jgi:hypothetical protein
MLGFRRAIKAFAAFAVTLLFLSMTVGCDDIAKGFGYTRAKATQPTKREPATPTHRFVIMNFGADVGFDSQTGQICRTWDWQPLGKIAKPDAETGGSPQRKFGEFAPTCLSLYQQYPSVANPNEPLGMLNKEQSN